MPSTYIMRFFTNCDTLLVKSACLSKASVLPLFPAACRPRFVWWRCKGQLDWILFVRLLLISWADLKTTVPLRHTLQIYRILAYHKHTGMYRSCCTAGVTRPTKIQVYMACPVENNMINSIIIVFCPFLGVLLHYWCLHAAFSGNFLCVRATLIICYQWSCKFVWNFL